MHTMVSILAWSVILGLVQILLAALPAIAKHGLVWAASPRDHWPAPEGVAARLKRAQVNFLETFPLFAALALAAMSLGHADAGQALLGAQIYFWARVVYVPVYAAGIPWVRTLAWTASIVGMVMVLLTLF